MEKKPKFRAKGAETRHLVPFGVELASELFEAAPDNVKYKTIAAMMGHLLAFYQTMGNSPFDSKLAASSAKSFCILYSELSRTSHSDRLWKMKPKMHMFSELAEYGAIEIGDPSLFWCYIDEDYVGWISQLAFSRGGKRLAVSTPENVIGRYRALA